MSRRSRHGVATGLGVATAVVVPGALAHVAVGGSLAVLPSGSALLAIAVVGALADRLRLRWTYPRLVAVALAAQPLLHNVFAAGHGVHPVAGTHLGHVGQAGHTPGEHALEAAGSAHHGPWMTVAHVAVAFAVAAGLRWGMRWLRSMPALARALVLPCRGPFVPFAAQVWSAAPCPEPRPHRLVALGAHGSRGPPH